MVGGCVAVALGLLDVATMGDHRACVSNWLSWFTAVQMDAGALNSKPKAAPASDFARRFSRFLVGEELLGSPE